MTQRALILLTIAVVVAWTGQVNATPFFFSTGDPDGAIATASRPSSPGKVEIESADDFVVTSGNTLTLTGANFRGLLPTGAGPVTDVKVEIYRVFPADSDPTRTSGPPTFSTSQVPTRVNSPSDVEFASRAFSEGNLTFTPFIGGAFAAPNSVLNGIHLQTGGDHVAVTGQQVSFNVMFTTPFTLPADHYFFVPQVQLSSGDFFWLSAPRPIGASGTQFPPGFTDLQSWIRNGELDPDWLRIGTDIVGGTTFNASFALSGDLEPVPEPATLILLGTTMAATGLVARRRRRGQR